MKAIFITMLILFLVTFLIVFIKNSKASKLSSDDIEYIKSKMIIRNKDQFNKETIQKAQQKIDEYLYKTNNA